MISDTELQRMLEVTAADYEVPPNGVDALLAARDRLAQPTRERPRTRAARRLGLVRRTGPDRSAPQPRLRWAAAALTLVAVVVGAGIGLGQLSDRSSTDGSSTDSTAVAPSTQSGPQSNTAPTSPRTAAGSGSGSGSAAVPDPGIGTPGDAGTSTTAPAEVTPRVVQTGEISLAVDAAQVPVVLDRLGALASGLKGYVASSSSQDSSGRAYGSITLRVPANAYAQVLAQARGLGRVTRSSSNADDVTGRYVDLGARITALQQTRATYLTLLSKAGTIGETLSVQQQITEVQTEIEQLQGQQQVLVDRAALATVEVTVTEPGPSAVSESSSSGGFRGAFRDAAEGFTGGLQWLIKASGPVLLIGLIVLVLFWPARRLVRRVRRRLI